MEFLGLTSIVFTGDSFYPVILPGCFSQNIDDSSCCCLAGCYFSTLVFLKGKKIWRHFHQSRLWSALNLFCYARFSKHDKRLTIRYQHLSPDIPKPMYVGVSSSKLLMTYSTNTAVVLDENRETLLRVLQYLVPPKFNWHRSCLAKQTKLWKHSHQSSYNMRSKLAVNMPHKSEKRLALTISSQEEIENGKACLEKSMCVEYFYCLTMLAPSK